MVEAKDYRRLIGSFRQSVKNGWSGRTKRQAEYLGGAHVRLEEMSSLLEQALRYKDRLGTPAACDILTIDHE